MELNLARYGMVIGHEITHGFDNSGAHYDGDGRYRNWWQPADLEEFNKRGQCLVDQYNEFTMPVPGGEGHVVRSKCVFLMSNSVESHMYVECMPHMLTLNTVAEWPINAG